MTDKTLQQTLNEYDQGLLKANEPFYDWFCSEKALVGRGKKLFSRLHSIINSKKINLNTMYVFFKNNCPCAGKLYDDFRLCDIQTGNVIYTVIPASGHYSNLGEAEVYGRENDFKEPLVKGTWKDVKQFFLEE